MRCFNCGCDNKPDVKFCRECGSDLSISENMRYNNSMYSEVHMNSMKKSKNGLIAFLSVICALLIVLAGTVLYFNFKNDSRIVREIQQNNDENGAANSQYNSETAPSETSKSSEKPVYAISIPENTAETNSKKSVPTMMPSKNKNGDYYLVGLSKPYEIKYCESYMQDNGESFLMSGQKYSNGITLGKYAPAYALFNLENKYTQLTFTIGHVDKSEMKPATVTFFLDGQEVKTIEVKADDMPKEESVELYNGSQLKIVKTGENYTYPMIGIAEMAVK